MTFGCSSRLPIALKITILILNLFVSSDVLAVTKSWTGNTSNNWNTASNWSPSGVPASTDDVVINDISPLNISFSTGPKTVASLTVGTTTSSTVNFSEGDAATKRLIVTGNMTVGSLGTLTVPYYSNPPWHNLNIEVGGSFTLASGATVIADGYFVNHCDAGPGPGGGGTGTRTGGGGGHGGAGSSGSHGGTGGITYDSQSAPTLLGSGGAGAGCWAFAGPGGGGLKLKVAGTATINGTINADGLAGGAADQGYAAGGGSGGGIWIIAGVLAGNGVLTAKGGAGGIYGVYKAGSGGAVEYR